MLSKETADLLTRLRERGVRIWLEGERIVTEPAPLPDDLGERLVAQRDEVASFLREMAMVVEPEAGDRIATVSRDGSLQLSFAQRRLWFLHRMGESAAYNMMLGLHLRGPLDVAALERSLGEVIRRHESLRTTFGVENGEPVQIISDPRPFELAVVDLSAEPDPQARARADASRAAETAFDVAVAPLWAITLYALAPDEHVLSITLAHIVADGLSAKILWDEVVAGYRALRAGAEPDLPALDVGYADYAHWQHEWQESDAYRALMASWRERLEGLPTLDLPTDRPRPPVQTFSGGRVEFALSEESCRRLRALAAAEGCTFFMAGLAVFQILLARYSGQEDIVVGTPVANRERVELEPLIGLFVNSLVLRTDLSGDPGFREVLRRVAASTASAFDAQEMPFEHLVAELRPERDLSRNPLFQVMFNLLGDGEWAALDDVVVAEFEPDNPTSKFELTLAIRDTGGSARGILEFNSDLFDEATVRRMAAQLQLLIQGVLDDPDRRIWNHDIVTPEERGIVLAEPSYDPFPDDRCLHTLVEEQVARTPDAIAVEFGGVSLTYAELNARANQLAHHLRSLGVEPEQLIGLSVERSEFMPIGMLGILKSGAAYVPMDPAYPPERLAFMLEDAQAKLFVTQESVLARMPEEVAKPVLLDAHAAEIAAASRDNPELRTGPDSLAHAIFSSGSTGRPKGALIRHRSLCNVFWAFQDRPGIERDDVLIAVTNIAFDLAGLDMFLPLIVGARMVIVPTEVVSDGRRLAALIRERRGTFMDATPSMWKLLVDSGWEGEPALRCVTGGEMMPRDLAERLAATCRDLWDCYAPCESTIYSTRYRFVPGGPLSVGKPLSNTQFYLLDPHGRPAPLGVTGDIHIGGVGLARGYLNRPEMTAERFVRNPFSSDPDARLYHTGDLARYNADGNLELLGRSDHQLKLRGFRIELGEIEHALGRHPAVQECAVVARDRGAGDKQLVAFVVFAEGQSATFGELRDALREGLPEFMIPSGFAVLDALPLTPNRKVDRKKLSESDDAVTLDAGHFVAPRTRMETLVAEVWRDALGLERVGVHDNFFELGGHSLLAMKVVFDLEQRVGHEVLPMDLLVESLEQFARTCERRAGLDPEPLPDAGDAAPVAAVPVTPLFFASGELELYGVHHAPQGDVRDTAVLLCAPFGHEGIASHAGLTQLATRLARAGFAVLRFDVAGCGDSEGDLDVLRWELWRSDVAAAQRELRERSGATRVCAVGLRLGASLAAQVGGFAAQVLWEPIVDGADHVRELEQLQQDWVRTTFVRAHAAHQRGGPAVLGFPFPEALSGDLRGLDLTGAEAPAGGTLIVQNVDGGHLDRLAARDGFVLERMPSAPPWIGEQGHTIAVASPAVVQRIVDWISEVANR